MLCYELLVSRQLEDGSGIWLVLVIGFVALSARRVVLLWFHDGIIVLTYSCVLLGSRDPVFSRPCCVPRCPPDHRTTTWSWILPESGRNPALRREP